LKKNDLKREKQLPIAMVKAITSKVNNILRHQVLGLIWVLFQKPI